MPTRRPRPGAFGPTTRPCKCRLASVRSQPENAGMFRSAPWTLVGLLLLACPACASEITNTWIRGVFTGKSPRPVALAESEAWRQAGALAERAPDSFVLVGSGQSMQPL